MKQIFLNFKQFLEEIGSKKSKIFTKISNKNRILLMKNFADYFFQEMRRLCIQNIDEVEQILNSGPAKDNYDSDDSENKYNLDEMNSDMLSKKKIFSVDFKDKNEKIFKKELDLLKKKKQNLLSDFSYFTGQEKKSRFSKSKTLKNFEEKFSKYLKKYGEYLDLLLSERNRNFNEELLQGKIDFIQKIEIEKKEDEIKKIINEKNLGILEKLSMFVKKIL
ncbi:hypothetical protein [Holospora elegans]|uniref:hypothetical protein n=1 Tax=Holospora elegans TaxID=431043 RepID=UPI001392350A|nr:hypothetical protein [Holospora elegans]